MGFDYRHYRACGLWLVGNQAMSQEGSTNNKVIIKDFFSSDKSNRIESIKLDNGTIVDLSDIETPEKLKETVEKLKARQRAQAVSNEVSQYMPCLQISSCIASIKTIFVRQIIAKKNSDQISFDELAEYDLNAPEINKLIQDILRLFQDDSKNRKFIFTVSNRVAGLDTELPELLAIITKPIGDTIVIVSPDVCFVPGRLFQSFEKKYFVLFG